MKSSVKVILASAIVFLFTVSTVFADSNPPFSGFLGGPEVYKQLKPGPEGGAKLRWIKPGVDLKKYKKFMVDSVIFYVSDKSENKAVDPEFMKEMADTFNNEMVAAFKGKYEMVSEPGPDVARIRIAITNVTQSKPVLSAITTIVPVGAAVSLVKRGVTGGWTGGGETSAEVMWLDSTTNDVIGMAVDLKQAAFHERFSKSKSAKDTFWYWSRSTVQFIDDVNGVVR